MDSAWLVGCGQIPAKYMIKAFMRLPWVRDPVDRAMVEMIQRISAMMGKHTIAEYVEDLDTLNMLRACGVHYAQGYGIARPQPFYDPRPVPAQIAAPDRTTTSP